MTILIIKGVADPIDRAERARAPMLGSVTLEIDGGEPLSLEGASRFEILADGARLRVDASGLDAARIKLEEKSKKGAWAEVEADPLAQPFLDKAPGPHIQVKLRGAALMPGETVHVLGEVTATEPVEATGSMRTPPVYRPSEIKAIAVATGPAAQRFVEQARAEHAPAVARPASPSGPLSWKAWAWIAGALAAVALMVSAAAGSRAARVELWLLALTCIAILMRFQITPPKFRGREAEPALGWWDLYYLVAALAVPISALFFLVTAASAVATRMAGSYDHATWIVPLLAAVTAVLPLEAWAKTRQFHRIARLLLDARLDATKDGAWAGVEGVVVDPTPIEWAGGAAAIGRRIDLHHDPSISVDQTFDIDTGNERVSVDAAEACWATLITRTVTEHEALGGDRTKAKSIVEEWIPIGAGVLAAGRIRRSDGAPRMTSTGPESLLLFAVASRSSARSELSAHFRARRSALFVLIIIAVFAAASALAYVGPLLAW